MQRVLSAKQMREIDELTVKEFQIPSLALMEAAAHACLQAIANHFDGKLEGKRIQILCGPGNNGGDGAALANELARLGVNIEVVLFGKVEETKGDARTNFEIVQRLATFDAAANNGGALRTFTECCSQEGLERLSRTAGSYDVIVDALFGVGLNRPLEGIYVDVVQYLARIKQSNQNKRPWILSVDLPSGLDADLALPPGKAVESDSTVTFTAPKLANVLPPAAEYNGRLIVAQIGSPASLVAAAESHLFVTDENDVRNFLLSTRYTPDSFKNSHGHVLIIAGSRGYVGAAVLCGNAAMRSGAGLVTIATPASLQSDVSSLAMPEIMTVALAETDRGTVSDEALDHLVRLTSKAAVVAIGPGLSSEDERTRRFVRGVVERRQVPVIIDADGLNCLSPWPDDLAGSNPNPVILTPHPGEMRRLRGADFETSDRIDVVRAFATSHKVIVLLKGSRSIIAAPDGSVFVNPTGNAGAGTAGAGDTLTGLIAGFVGQAQAMLKTQADPLAATIAALYIGGLAADFAAADLGMRTMVASDIRERFSEAIRAIDPEGERPPSLA